MAVELHPDFLIQAHRGAGAAQPENTLEACEYTWSASPWLIPECDVSTTVDGMLVAFHDNKLSRTAINLGSELMEKSIGEVTLEQARTVDVGIGMGPQFAKRYIPSLVDLFEKMKGRPERRLYLDHKRASLPDLAELVGQSGVGRRVIFCSSKWELVTEWKALIPEAKTLLWVWNDGAEAMAGKVDKLRKIGFKDIDAIQLHVHCLPEGAFIPAAEFIRDLISELEVLGKAVQIYPFERAFAERCSLQAIGALMDLGVESFATDFPEDVLRCAMEKNRSDRI